MKRKFLIFALCCIMLFGVFSVNVFAEDTYDITSCSYYLPSKGWECNPGRGSINVNGSITYTPVDSSTEITKEFYNFRVGYNDSKSSANYITFMFVDDTKAVFQYYTAPDIFITFYDNTTNSQIYNFLKDYEYYHSLTLSPGWTVPSGYGVFNVNGTCNGSPFSKLLIGFDNTGKEFENLIMYLSTSTYAHNPLYTNSSYEIVVTGGEDFNNSDFLYFIEGNLNHVHSYTSTIVSPTHVEKGYTLYTCECGDSYQDNFVAALGHNYTITEKVDPSCTTKGYTTYVCDCGYTYTEEGAAYGHTFTTTTVDPTCTKKGSKTYVCDCGYSYSEELPTLPHTYSSSVVDPTCSRKGYTTYVCECGYSYRDNYVDTIPHVFEGTRCSVCNALDPSYIIKSKDFSNVFVRLSEQIKVNTVVGVLGVAAAACVGLVFMWLGGRKLVRALMSAFKKGKISL